MNYLQFYFYSIFWYIFLYFYIFLCLSHIMYYNNNIDRIFEKNKYQFKQFEVINIYIKNKKN